jgi:membrane protein implicated in regulation of membrane protease activity
MDLLTAVPFHQFPPGTQGIVVLSIAPLQPGRVQYQGTSWPARLDQSGNLATLLSGQPVFIIGRQELTLLVAPWHCELPKKINF